MDKPLSDKQFIRKASAKISANAFLDAYEAHIRETYPEATETVELYRSGQMPSTQALDFVKNVATQHMLAMMVNRAEESIRNQNKKAEKKSGGSTGTGKCTCQIFVKETCERTGESKIVLWVDHNGNHTFNTGSYQDALRLVDRKQVDLSMGQYAIIVTKLTEGKLLTNRVDRLESMARFFKSRPGPVCKVKPQSAPLKQKMSVHNYVASFSRG